MSEIEMGLLISGVTVGLVGYKLYKEDLSIGDIIEFIKDNQEKVKEVYKKIKELSLEVLEKLFETLEEFIQLLVSRMEGKKNA